MADNSGKDDKNKIPMYQGIVQSFPRALAAIAAHTQKGAEEPGHRWHGWKEAQDGFHRYSNAFMRHLMDEGHGHYSSDDFKTLVAQVTATCWNDLARLEHLLTDQED